MSRASPIDPQQLIELMREHHGNVSSVAQRVGVERQSLHRLLNKHAIRPRDYRLGRSAIARLARERLRSINGNVGGSGNGTGGSGGSY